MAENKILLSFDRDFFSKLKSKAKQRGFKSVEQFIVDLVRHNVYRRKALIKKRDSETLFLDKFSSPTKKTAKIMRSIQPK